MNRDIMGILSQMTLEEKAGLCSGLDHWHTKPVERLGIPSIRMSDGPHGLRKQAQGGDHLGLMKSLPATCFPYSCYCSLLLGQRADQRGRSCLGRGMSG